MLADAIGRGADYVLHLAAMTSVPRSVKDPVASNRVNVDGIVHVLVSARDAGVRRVVFASSSCDLRRNSYTSQARRHAPVPISPYGVSKLVGELYGNVFQHAYGVEFVSLRYFNVFGPRQDPRLALLRCAIAIYCGDAQRRLSAGLWRW